jgi:hypothetical protein
MVAAHLVTAAMVPIATFLVAWLAQGLHGSATTQAEGALIWGLVAIGSLAIAFLVWNLLLAPSRLDWTTAIRLGPTRLKALEWCA